MPESTWRVLCDQNFRSAHEQMAGDERLAHEAQPTVRIFRWSRSAISLGWKQPVPPWVQIPSWRAAGIEMVERPTGGGIALHGSDVSVSVVVPRALGIPLPSLMRAVGESAVQLCESHQADARLLLDVEAQERITYCLTESSPYAVMSHGRKVAGFALRRYPESWLIQGSLLVEPLAPALLNAMPDEMRDQLAKRAVALSGASEEQMTIASVMRRWAERWNAWWMTAQRESAGAAVD